MDEVNFSCWVKFKKVVFRNLLTICLISSISLGCVLGIIIRKQLPVLEERVIGYLSFPGFLLIRIIKCSAIPLMIACVITALGTLDLSVSRSISWQFALILVGTKILTSFIGFGMVLTIYPGRYGNVVVHEEWQGEQGVILDIFLDGFRNIFNDNMMRMYIQQYETFLEPPENNQTDDTLIWKVKGKYINCMNILGIIFIATGIGVCLNIIQEQDSGLFIIVQEVYILSMKISTWILWCCPIFIFFLIFAEILRIDDFNTFMSRWGAFLLTTHAGFLTVFLVEYPLIVFLLTRENPFKFYYDMTNVFVTAYATSSSLGTMPVLIDGLIKHGLDERLVRFIVPIGININKVGSVNFFVVTIVFVAQASGASLSIGHYCSIAALSIMVSMAAAAVPFSGVVALVMILNGLGLEQNLVAGILAVEVINDRATTLCNVAGNCCQPKILAKWNKRLLNEAKSKEHM